MSTTLFWREVRARPLEMGAIVPSSGALARRIVACAGIRRGDVVAELGAGSGAFTSEIVARHPDNSLLVLEPSLPLAAHLASAHPRARVYSDGAEDLPEVVRSAGLTRVDRVISGLPWALWERARQERVLDAIVSVLSPDAVFVTFHYLHSDALGAVAPTRELLGARFEEVARSDVEWRNLPPAYVCIARRPRVGVAP